MNAINAINRISDWVKGYTNHGLNADWCVSVYRVGGELTLFDNEDGTFTLYHQPELYMDDEDERSFRREEIGTFMDHEVESLEQAIAEND